MMVLKLPTMLEDEVLSVWQLELMDKQQMGYKAAKKEPVVKMEPGSMQGAPGSSPPPSQKNCQV